VTAHISGDSVVETVKLLGGHTDVSELSEMIDFLPPRTLDGQGREGDMLNLIFIAEEDDLEGAFERAGWVKTDKSKPTICWHLLQQRKHYTQAAHGQALRVRESAGFTRMPCLTRLRSWPGVITSESGELTTKWTEHRYGWAPQLTTLQFKYR
jgi:LssY C-terminus